LDYDARRGTFRGWLFAVTRNQLRKYLHRTRRAERVLGDWSQNTEPSDRESNEEEAVWQQEYRRRLFHLASERTREEFEPTSWRAFWETAVEGRSAQEVSRTLGMSVGAIYTAKSRVLARLKSAVAELEERESC
jgi:RNA polymerase sigma-70 factor (ECF subfamily)